LLSLLSAPPVARHFVTLKFAVFVSRGILSVSQNFSFFDWLKLVDDDTDDPERHALLEKLKVALFADQQRVMVMMEGRLRMKEDLLGRMEKRVRELYRAVWEKQQQQQQSPPPSSPHGSEGKGDDAGGAPRGASPQSSDDEALTEAQRLLRRQRKRVGKLKSTLNKFRQSHDELTAKLIICGEKALLELPPLHSSTNMLHVVLF
jgi:hypothetical protein